MASTNHTTNYGLSQFTQTDKPAWLGDYNQDMTKIDTAMKDNADDIATVETTVAAHTTAIAGNTSDIASVQTNVATNTSDIEDLQEADTEFDSRITAAQNTADTASGKADTNAENITAAQNNILALQRGQSDNETAINNLTTSVSGNTTAITNLANELSLSEPAQRITAISGVGNINNCNVTLLQSPNSVLFKVYGVLDFGGTSGAKTIARTAVTGLSGYYGFKTTLKLKTAPTSTYMINGCGYNYSWTPADSLSGRPYFGGNSLSAMAVDNQGYIWLDVYTQNTFTLASYERYTINYTACIYFNADMGDQVIPDNN